MLPGHDYAGARFDPRRGAGAANGARRHAPAEDHVERWFLAANDPSGARGLYVAFGIVAPARHPGAAVAEACAVAFDHAHGHVAVKEQVPVAAARFSPRGLGVEVAGCTLEEGRSRGALETGARRVGWDLTFAPCAPPRASRAHPVLSALGAVAPTLVTPHPEVRLAGSVTVGGVRFALDGYRGVVGHGWGRDHPEVAAWGQAALWEGAPELLIEGTTTQVRLGPVARLATCLAVRYRGVRYDLTGATDVVRSRADLTVRRWRFEGRTDLVEVRGELNAECDDLVGLYLPAARGHDLAQLASVLARGRVELRVRGGAPVVATTRAATLVVTTGAHDHGVRMYV